MIPLCESCDISGKEKKIGSRYTLEECKSECSKDADCLGIDFGKGKRSGECYFNYDQGDESSSHQDFDAWSKSSDCGKIFCNFTKSQEIKFSFFAQINFLNFINLSFILDEYDSDALEDYDSNDDTMTNYENEEYDTNEDDDGELEDDDNGSFFDSEEKDDFEGTS